MSHRPGAGQANFSIPKKGAPCEGTLVWVSHKGLTVELWSLYGIQKVRKIPWHLVKGLRFLKEGDAK